MPLNYCAVVHFYEDGLFWIEFPDFPEISTRGSNRDDNPATLAADCLADAILLRLEEGEALPLPSDLSAHGLNAASSREEKEVMVIQVTPKRLNSEDRIAA